MTNSGRLCLFCGKPFTGQKRNFEHVIPKWLVEFADLKTRQMEVNTGSKVFKMSMRDIGAKSCESCNTASSKLEQRAKIAFYKIRDAQDFDTADIQSLLDWLDKVRIGLWLWMLGVTKAPITPKFRINERVARKDRFVVISKYPSGPPMKGLAFWGFDELFLAMPSVLGLLANNIAIVSASADFILLQHFMKVRINRKIRNLPQDEFNIEKIDNEPSRLTLFEAAAVFGQCILPKAAKDEFPELGFLDVTDDLVATPLSQLNSRLQPIGPACGKVVMSRASTEIGTTLSELNITTLNDFILRENLRADFSSINDKQFAKKEVAKWNRLLFMERLQREHLARRYKELSGVTLPI